MIDGARRHFDAEKSLQPNQVVELMEITMSNLLSTGPIDLNDFLARAEVLAAAGKTVLISDYSEYYRLAAWLTRHTAGPIGITMGVASLQEIFQERYYTDLEGGILEAFGRLFTKDLRIYVYPMANPNPGPLITVDTADIPENVRALYRHLVATDRIRQLENVDQGLLHILSRDVLRRIREGDVLWEGMVPAEIAAVIRSRRFFGYRIANPADHGEATVA